MMKNAVYGHLVQHKLDVAYESSIFWSMLMLHKYWYNNYAEETK